MKKITVLLAVILFSASIVGFESCQSTKSSTATKMLKFDLEKGKGYDYELIMNMNQEIMGQDMELDMTTYYSMDVDGDEGGTKMITTAIDRLKMKTVVAGFNVNFDTDAPLQSSDTSDMMGKSMGALNKVFGAIKGQKFTMKVSPEGKITEVTGFENMAKSIADSMKIEGDERAEMMKQFDGQFNANEMTQSLERFWFLFPNKEVKVGDSWQKSMQMGGKMPGKYNSTYKVTEIEGDMVTIDEESKIEALETEEVSLTGKVTGTIIVDSRSGLIVTADQDMKMKASAKGMSFDIKAKTKIKGKAR